MHSSLGVGVERAGTARRSDIFSARDCSSPPNRARDSAQMGLRGTGRQDSVLGRNPGHHCRVWMAHSGFVDPTQRWARVCEARGLYSDRV